MLHNLGSLEPLFQIMDSNLAAKPSEDTVANWGSQIGTQPQLILREMGKPKVIVNGLKKRLDDAKGRWVEELPHVLWVYRTTPQWSIGKTPFAMTYGAEAVIPLEANFPTLRTNSFTPSSNDELLGESLDLIKERRERAMIHLAYYHQRLK